MANDVQLSLDTLYELLYVTTYGCNRRLEQEVRRLLENYGLRCSFVFHEYFLHQPLTKEMEFDANDTAYLLAPFAIRMIENSLVVPLVAHIDDIEKNNDRDIKYRKKINERVTYISRDDHFSHKTKIKILNKSSWFTKKCFERWKKNNWSEAESSPEETKWGLNYHICSIDYPVGYFEKFQPSIFKEVAEQVFCCGDNNPHFTTNMSRNLHYGFMRLIFTETTEGTIMPSLFMPISSSHIFYGVIWLKFSERMPETMPEKNQLLERIKKVGSGIAMTLKDIYVPTLAIMHNHFFEKFIKNNVSNKNYEGIKLLHTVEGTSGTKEEVEYKNVFYKTYALKEKSYKANVYSEPIEMGLFELWKKRKGFSGEIFNKSLIFSNYTVCSSKMIDLTRKVIKDAKTIKVNIGNGPQPSALVIGGAGSGKDTFSEMLSIFSKNFCAGNRYKINMASLKPAPLVSGLMTGVEAKRLKIGWLRGRQILDHSLKGIFHKIREKTQNMLMYCKEVDKFDKFPTLILDELNSMDIDSQGVLLRFLENAEIVPLGGIEDNSDKKYNHCLVIGVMNEDPDELSREKATEFIRNESYLGGLLGDLLYEHFARIRRLRPDIKYRMVRNGKYKLPLLRERKEDIPLLFNVFCEKELKNLDSTKCLHISLETFDELMSERHIWLGNIRELQALAKQAVLIANNEAQREGEKVCLVLRSHIDRAFKNI